jgi:hypothetical protein
MDPETWLSSGMKINKKVEEQNCLLQNRAGHIYIKPPTSMPTGAPWKSNLLEEVVEIPTLPFGASTCICVVLDTGSNFRKPITFLIFERVMAKEKNNHQGREDQ